MKTSAYLASIICVVIMSGCASHHLRVTTTQHASSLADIYETQVLNNLARFKRNPHATPHFELPSSGGSEIEDSASLAAEPLNAFRKAVGLSVDRNVGTAWTLAPVTDPDKLARMKCAFQRAVGYIPPDCDDCCKIQREIVKPKSGERAIQYPDGTFSPTENCNDPCQVESCWFRCSTSRRDAMRCARQFGYFDGTYVWVPESGRKAFSKLVFDTLNYATKDPSSIPKKQVTVFLDEAGNPTTPFLASQMVTSEIKLTDKNKAVAAEANISTRNKTIIPKTLDAIGLGIEKLLKGKNAEASLDKSTNAALDVIRSFSAKPEFDNSENQQRQAAAEEASIPSIRKSIPSSDSIRRFNLERDFLFDRE